MIDLERTFSDPLPIELLRESPRSGSYPFPKGRVPGEPGDGTREALRLLRRNQVDVLAVPQLSQRDLWVCTDDGHSVSEGRHQAPPSERGPVAIGEHTNISTAEGC